MKHPSHRVSLIGVLGFVAIVIAVWIMTGRKQEQVGRLGSPVDGTPLAAVSDPTIPPSEAAGMSVSVRELVDRIQRVLNSPETKLSQDELRQIMSLPEDDPRKKAYRSEGVIRAMATRNPERYASLFTQLGLNADEIQMLTKLQIGRDLMLREHLMPYTRETAVRVTVKLESAGPFDPASFTSMGSAADPVVAARLDAEASGPIEAEIKRMLGDEKFTIYDNYMQALPVISSLEDFQHRLNDANLPILSDAQSAHLLAALMTDYTPTYNGFTNLITANVLQAGQAVLEPAQLEVLQHIANGNQEMQDAIVAALKAKKR
ncbi:MAG: hypothetical protein WCL04_01775 [Verrucomicrobiota bacterium]